MKVIFYIQIISNYRNTKCKINDLNSYINKKHNILKYT